MSHSISFITNKIMELEEIISKIRVVKFSFGGYFVALFFYLVVDRIPEIKTYAYYQIVNTPIGIH